MRKFNWDYLYFKITEKGYAINEYAQKKLGKSGSYLSYYKNRRIAPPTNSIVFMIKDLELNEDALWQIQEVEEPKVDVAEAVVEPENTDTVDTANELDTEILREIKDEIVKLREYVMYLNLNVNAIVKKDNTTPLERLLRMMLGDE